LKLPIDTSVGWQRGRLYSESSIIANVHRNTLVFWSDQRLPSTLYLSLLTNFYFSHRFGTAINMSTSSRQTTNISTSNFTSISKSATKEYKKLVKKDLYTHPFAAQFYRCDSPQAVLVIFQGQSQAFEESRKGDDRLMRWFDPMANILFMCSATLGEGLALVVCIEEVSASLFPDTRFLAILPRKNDLCWYRFAPRFRSLQVPLCTYACHSTFPGSE
jgi:hypothetical protein